MEKRQSFVEGFCGGKAKKHQTHRRLCRESDAGAELGGAELGGKELVHAGRARLLLGDRGLGREVGRRPVRVVPAHLLLPGPESKPPFRAVKRPART